MSNLSYFLATRNMASNKGLGLQQATTFGGVGIPLSRSYPRWFALWTSETLAPYLQGHYQGCRCLSSASDPGVVGRIVNPGQETIAVQLDDGKVGYCSEEETEKVVDALRHYNVSGAYVGTVPLDIELGHVPISHGGQYPSLYIFSTPALMMRPVKHLANVRINMVGSFEQVYMKIGYMDDEVCPGENKYQELSPITMLRVIANLMPFFKFNESP
ncbi:putative RPA135-DNA-directed RNA polymerase I, 135 kd subunit, partial [Dissophora ornata]